MVGTLEVFRKEMADHLSSYRLYIITFLVYIIGFSMSFSSISSIRLQLKRTLGESVFLKVYSLQTGLIPSFLGFIAYFGPLISLILVFDAINRETSQGPMGLLVSQPIHRDSIINGKFSATSATVAILLMGVFGIITGFTVMTLGTLPTMEEALRITVFYFVSVIYLSFWIGMGLLYSIVFEREGTSALASIATWIFFNVFVYMIADIVKSTGGSSQSLLLFTPTHIYTQASSVIMIPNMRLLGPISYERVVGMLPTPLSFTQSILLIWPHLTTLTAAMMLIFTVSYLLFVKREIRST